MALSNDDLGQMAKTPDAAGLFFPAPFSNGIREGDIRDLARELLDRRLHMDNANPKNGPRADENRLAFNQKDGPWRSNRWIDHARQRPSERHPPTANVRFRPRPAASEAPPSAPPNGSPE